LGYLSDGTVLEQVAKASVFQYAKLAGHRFLVNGLAPFRVSASVTIFVALEFVSAIV
jgi:hypothetical protein